MSKVKPTTKEQLVYYLSNNISLGTYDKKFINNLITMYVTPNKPVTTNQNDLLEKIVVRYSRQLAKQEISAEEMNKLSWTVAPIQSTPQYTEAHLTIKDDTIELRSPFKSDFVKQFREIPYAKWNREDKAWYVPYCEEILFIVTKMVNQHYNTVNYDDNIKRILNTVETYVDIKYWHPTLIKTNNRFYIAASNQSLNNAIQEIELNDDYHTIARLTRYGIKIDDSIISQPHIDIAKMLKVIDRSPHIESNTDELLDYLLTIKADYVYLREWQFVQPIEINKFKEKLESHGIQYEVIHRNRKILPLDQKYKLPVTIGNLSFTSPMAHCVAKTIMIVNSNEIEIK